MLEHPLDEHRVERLRHRVVELRVLVHQIERREDDAHERGLRRRRARGLNDVVLPAVEGLEQDAEEQVAEERRDDRDVRTEAELEDDVRVRRAHDHRDDHARDQRARRELVGAGRFLWRGWLVAVLRGLAHKARPYHHRYRSFAFAWKIRPTVWPCSTTGWVQIACNTRRTLSTTSA